MLSVRAGSVTPISHALRLASLTRGSLSRQFTSLGLSEGLLKRLSKRGLKEPQEVQERAIPLLLSNNSCVIISQTGSGKTLAYLLPLIEKLSNHAPTQEKSIEDIYTRLSPQALIIVPTRELANQLSEQLSLYSMHPVSIFPPTLGTPLTKLPITKITLSTPQAIIDFVKLSKPTGTFNLRRFLSKTQTIVIDEVDIQLTEAAPLSLITHSAFKGLIKKVEEGKFMGYVSDGSRRQYVFVGATLPTTVNPNAITPRSILQKHFQECVDVVCTNVHATPTSLSESFIRIKDAGISRQEAEELRMSVLKECVEDYFDTDRHMTLLVFTNAGNTIPRIISTLETLRKESGTVLVELDTMHSSKYRDEKEKILRKYTHPIPTSEVPVLRILVCTDVMSHGIDFNAVDVLFHYDFPANASTYLHRVGRTARAGNSGMSIALVGEKDAVLASYIELAARGQSDLKMEKYNGLMGEDEDKKQIMRIKTPLTAFLGRRDVFRNRFSNVHASNCE